MYRPYTSQCIAQKWEIPSPEITNFQPRNYQFPAQKLPISPQNSAFFWCHFPAQKLPISSPEIANFQPRNYQFPAQKLPISSVETTILPAELSIFRCHFPAQKLPISSPEITNFPAQKLPISSPEISKIWQWNEGSWWGLAIFGLLCDLPSTFWQQSEREKKLILLPNILGCVETSHLTVFFTCHSALWQVDDQHIKFNSLALLGTGLKWG